MFSDKEGREKLNVYMTTRLLIWAMHVRDNGDNIIKQRTLGRTREGK
jgi:hypothetical protein